MKYCYKIVLITLLASLAFACGSSEPATPLDTLKAYVAAVKKKDTAMMKMLLSEASLNIHRDQAKAQNVTLDEIIQRETLFSETQRIFGHRNEKIEGDRATIEVQNDFGGWDIVHLVKESGIWKIDKKAFRDEIINQNEEAEKNLDDEINSDREKSNKADSNSNTGNENTNVDPAVDPNAPKGTDDPNAAWGATPNDAGDPSKSSGGNS